MKLRRKYFILNLNKKYVNEYISNKYFRYIIHYQYSKVNIHAPEYIKDASIFEKVRILNLSFCKNPNL